MPVLLGDVTTDDTLRNGLGPLDLAELQFVRPPSAKESDANAKDLIKQVVARFKKLAGPPVDPELQEWLRLATVCLKKVDPSDRAAAAATMGIDREDFTGTEERQCEILAYHMLFSDLPLVEAALPTLAHSMGADQLGTFAHLVLPTLVSAEAARTILPIAQRPEDARRFVAINTEYQDIAEQYVRRATCCNNRVAVVKATGVRGESSQLALAASTRPSAAS